MTFFYFDKRVLIYGIQINDNPIYTKYMNLYFININYIIWVVLGLVIMNKLRDFLYSDKHVLPYHFRVQNHKLFFLVFPPLLSADTPVFDNK